MKQANLRLLFIAILLLTVGLVRGDTDLTPPRTVVLDLGKFPVRYQWDIGNHDREFALELDKSVSVTHGVNTVGFELSLAHPNLYERFLESLSSEAGYTTIAQSMGVKAQLGRVKELSMQYDEQAGTIWVRLTARVRLKAPLIRTTDNRRFVVEFATHLAGGMLQLKVRSLNISGVPGEIDKIIAKSIKPVNLQLSACLADKLATLEQASFTDQEQALKVAVALPTGEFVSAFWCLFNT